MAGISFDSAKNIINGGLSEAQEMLNDKNKVNDLLAKVEDKVKDLEKSVENFTIAFININLFFLRIL